MLASSFTASARRHTTYERSALMADGIRWVGLDVHAHESTIAIFDQATGEVMTKRVVGRPHVLMPWLRGVQRPARMVYEAGPTDLYLSLFPKPARVIRSQFRGS
jgi:hypothetical protein